MQHVLELGKCGAISYQKVAQILQIVAFFLTRTVCTDSVCICFVILCCTFSFIGLESPPHKLEREVGEVQGTRIFA